MDCNAVLQFHNEIWALIVVLFNYILIHGLHKMHQKLSVFYKKFLSMKSCVSSSAYLVLFIWILIIVEKW